MSADATLEILIQIREELAGLTRTKEALAETKKEGEGLGAMLKEGLGIGSGMELAREGIEFLKESFTELVHGAFEMATEIKHGTNELFSSGEAYQVIQLELAKSGVQMGQFSMALSHQTETLAQAQAGAGTAAGAYRTLGLDIASIASLAPEQRVIAVAKAALEAKDRTEAFRAAGEILGQRGLPALVSALKTLATDGYEPVADAAKKAGLIMGDETAEKLHQAEENIARLKRAATIAAGGVIEAGLAVKQAATKDTWSTIWSFLKTGGSPTNMGDFWAQVAAQQPVTPEADKKKEDPAAEAALRTRLTLMQDLKDMQTALAEAELKSKEAQDDAWTTASARDTEEIGLLKQKVALQEKILADLKQIGPAAGQNPADWTAEINKQVDKVVAAKNALTVALGGGYAQQYARIGLGVTQASAGAQAISGNPLLTETAQRQQLLPLIQKQIDLYELLNKAEFPDASTLQSQYDTGKITPEGLIRLQQYVALQEKLAALKNDKSKLTDTPLQQELRSMTDGTKLLQDSLASGLKNEVSSLSSGIWEAMKGTQSWSAEWRNMGNIAGQILTDLFVRLMVIKPLLDYFGLGGGALAGGGGGTTIGAATPVGDGGAFAGGGSFLTRGPTSILVGDNPGGIEHVSVTPLSGVGRTTVRGATLAMAGGGSALVAGGAGGLAGMDAPIMMHQTLVFNGGVSRSEVMGLIPQIVAQSKQAVRDAQRRRRDGFSGS